MAVKVITLNGKANIKLPDGKEKEITYQYKKIVTPATKRNAGTEEEQKDATFPQFAELVNLVNGNVEFKLIEKEVDGKKVMVLDEDAPTSISQYTIDGINLEWNKQAKDAKANTPAVQRAKARIDFIDMKKKVAAMGLSTTEIDGYLKQLDDLDAKEAAEEALAAKA